MSMRFGAKKVRSSEVTLENKNHLAAGSNTSASNFNFNFNFNLNPILKP